MPSGIFKTDRICPECGVHPARRYDICTHCLSSGRLPAPRQHEPCIVPLCGVRSRVLVRGVCPEHLWDERHFEYMIASLLRARP